jgi:hypothetical protein
LNTELPSDQRLDDARSLVFDSAPLDAPIEILGACTVALDVAVDKRVAFLAVRLNEVLPTGESSRVSYAILNLCHRDSDETPSLLTPGERYRVKLTFDNTARRFHAGSRIRLSISTTYWPLILPAPEPVRLTLFTGSTRLTLPARALRAADAQLRPFGPPFVPKVAIEPVSSNPGVHSVEWDAVNKRQVIRHEVGDGTVLLAAVNTRLIGKATVRSEIGEDETRGSITTQYLIGWQRDEWNPRVIAASKITTTPSDFVLSGELNAFDGEEKVFARRWERKIPRQLV